MFSRSVVLGSWTLSRAIHVHTALLCRSWPAFAASRQMLSPFSLLGHQSMPRSPQCLEEGGRKERDSDVGVEGGGLEMDLAIEGTV